MELINNFLTYHDGIGDMLEPISKVNTYQMGLCDLREVNNNLEVTLRRPGLLIGKAGENMNELEKYLGCKIIIVEKILKWKTKKKFAQIVMI